MREKESKLPPSEKPTLGDRLVDYAFSEMRFVELRKAGKANERRYQHGGVTEEEYRAEIGRVNRELWPLEHKLEDDRYEIYRLSPRDQWYRKLGRRIFRR